MSTHVDLIVTDVEAVTVRNVAGEGAQAELLLRTKAGTLAVRLVARRGRVIRLTDLRKRDQQRAKKTPFVSVPFSELVKP